MLGSFGFTLEMDDGANELDSRAWKGVVLELLAQSRECLVICDEELNVLYGSPRAVQLLERLATTMPAHVPRRRVGPRPPLPEAIAEVVRRQVTNGGSREQVPTAAGAAVDVRAANLRSVGRRLIMIVLREELVREDEHFALLRERFPITFRGFQLARLIRKGLTNRQIAESLNLTESTVKGYLHQLYRTCGVSSRTALIALLDQLP